MSVLRIRPNFFPKLRILCYVHYAFDCYLNLGKYFSVKRTPSESFAVFSPPTPNPKPKPNHYSLPKLTLFLMQLLLPSEPSEPS